MEEINEEDDLLDELDDILSSINIKSSSQVYEDHVPLHQQVKNHIIPVAPKEVVHEHHK